MIYDLVRDRLLFYLEKITYLLDHTLSCSVIRKLNCLVQLGQAKCLNSLSVLRDCTDR